MRDGVKREAARLGTPVWFIDGNHEDFDELDSLPLQVDGIRHVRDHIIHVPRAHRWTWGGRTTLACGGACSLDVMDRAPHVSWWPQEAITETDVASCIAGGPAHVLFTQDINIAVQLEGVSSADAVPPEVRQAIHRNREYLQRIVRCRTAKSPDPRTLARPSDQFLARGDIQRAVRVVSFNCDTSAALQPNGHCAILDLDVVRDDVPGSLTVVD